QPQSHLLVQADLAFLDSLDDEQNVYERPLVVEPGHQCLKQAPVEMVCQATVAHPKADISRAITQVLATSSSVPKETLKRANINAAQTLGFYRVHDGVGEGNTLTMFLFMLLQVGHILLERKPFPRPGAPASKHQSSTTAADRIIVTS